MATKYWIGTADAVAGVETGSIDSVDATPANNTFTVTIGGVAISAVGDTDVATTATNLRASLNASTHPYFSAITWSGGTGDIIGTADTAGVPFVAALTETGAGSGTVTDFAETTASAGPSDWSTADNWSDGVVPGASDTVIIAESAVSIVYGLDQNSIDLAALVVKQTYTGKIGLPRDSFATSADGATASATAKDEYRETYLKIGSTAIDTGEDFGPANPSGSGRIKINNVISGASALTVHDTAASATDLGLPCVRYLAAHASAAVYVRNGSGGVGVAVDTPGETATVGTISISHDTRFAFLHIGAGTTVTTVEAKGGRTVLESAGTVTTVTVEGGTLTTEGDFAVTNLNAFGGTARMNHVKSSGDEITTVNVDGGEVDARAITQSRTFATVNMTAGNFRGNASLTITTLNEPSSKDYDLAVS